MARERPGRKISPFPLVGAHGMTTSMRPDRLLSRGGGLLFACLAAAACTCDKPTAPDAGTLDAGPPTLTEVEPNDGPAQALVLDRTCLVQANLGADPAHPDEDWYVLKSGLPRTVDLVVTPPPGGDVGLEVMDEARTVLAQLNEGGPGQPERHPDLDVSGKVFVRVTTIKKGAGGAYTLAATFRDRVPGFELEPNDRKVDATAVPMGQAVSGFLSHASDVDWYRYELPLPPGQVPAAAPAEFDAGEADGGEAVDAGTALDAGVAPDAGKPPEPRLSLRVDVSGVEGVLFDVQVLTEAEAVLFQARSQVGAGLSLRNVGARASDRVLYVAVRSAPVGPGKDARRGANAATYYTLTVAPEDKPESAEFEPNDEPARATELRNAGWREGFLSPRGDVDYYRLVTDGPTLAKVQVSGVEKVNLVLSVIRPVEGKPDEVLLRADEGGVKEGEQLNDVQCDGSCYLRIEGAAHKVAGKWVSDDENGEQPYRLSVAVMPDDGTEEREPNGTAAQATPLTLGKAVRGTVYPKRDVDYFRLDLREKAVKTPITATLLGILKVDVGLYLHRVEADGKLTLVQTSDGARGDKPEVVRSALEPGLYVLEVRDARNREANFQDSYQLTVEESGD